MLLVLGGYFFPGSTSFLDQNLRALREIAEREKSRMVCTVGQVVLWGLLTPLLAVAGWAMLNILACPYAQHTCFKEKAAEVFPHGWLNQKVTARRLPQGG